jgi:hypothetical protein
MRVQNVVLQRAGVVRYRLCTAERCGVRAKTIEARPSPSQVYLSTGRGAHPNSA